MPLCMSSFARALHPWIPRVLDFFASALYDGHMTQVQTFVAAAAARALVLARPCATV